jgi:hypothetical protein
MQYDGDYETEQRQVAELDEAAEVEARGPGGYDFSFDFPPGDDERDFEEEGYWQHFCPGCGVSPCEWDGSADGYHLDLPEDVTV